WLFLAGLVGLEELRGEDDREAFERHLDQEDRPPRREVDEEGTEARGEHPAEVEADYVQRDRGVAMARELAPEDRLDGGHGHAVAPALDEPGQYQELRVRGQRTSKAPERVNHESCYPSPLQAETGTHPADQRHAGHRAEQRRAGYPLVAIAIG